MTDEYPKARCTVGWSSDGVNEASRTCYTLSAKWPMSNAEVKAALTFLTASSRADLISDKLALLIFVIGSGSEAREVEEGEGVVGREDPL